MFTYEKRTLPVITLVAMIKSPYNLNFLVYLKSFCASASLLYAGRLSVSGAIVGAPGCSLD